MTDHELESELRERLRAADLPVAPAALRRAVAELPEPAFGARDGRKGGMVLLAAASLVLIGVGFGGVLVGTRPPDSEATLIPTAAPSVNTVEPPATAAIVPAGFVPFEATGIAFAHPSDWVPSTAFDKVPSILGWRYVAAFSRAMTLCPPAGGDAAPTEPPGCEHRASEPGTLQVQVVEMLRQLPGTIERSGGQTTFAGYPASEPTHEIGDTDPIALTWFVSGPDDGIYMFWAQAPNAEIEGLRDQMEATLPTLQLSRWQPPPKVVDGKVHVDTGQGFSFDYPAGWTIYYPNDMSMADHAVVTLSSRPLEPPCRDDPCERFTVPPGTVAIEFRVGRGPTEPDWGDADASVDGQPARAYHWETTATGSDEGDQLNVRLDGERHVLSIQSSHRGPGIDEQRELVGQIIDSIQIDAPPP